MKFSKHKKSDIKRSKSYEDEVRQLKVELEKEKKLSAELKDKLVHALADYQNLEQNNQKRIEILSFQLKKDIAKQLIELADDIYFAMSSAKKLKATESFRSWLDGINRTLDKFKQIMSVIGVVPINVNNGDKFDSALHEAVATLPQGEVDTIHEIIQPGYSIGEHVIRPARVVVNKGSKSDKTEK